MVIVKARRAGAWSKNDGDGGQLGILQWRLRRPRLWSLLRRNLPVLGSSALAISPYRLIQRRAISYLIALIMRRNNLLYG